MKAQELTIDVNAHVGPSEESAARALQILNWYLKDNPDVNPSVMLCGKDTETPHRQIIIGKGKK